MSKLNPGKKGSPDFQCNLLPFILELDQKNMLSGDIQVKGNKAAAM
jgi:hypothetical protein